MAEPANTVPKIDRNYLALSDNARICTRMGKMFLVSKYISKDS